MTKAINRDKLKDYMVTLEQDVADGRSRESLTVRYRKVKSKRDSKGDAGKCCQHAGQQRRLKAIQLLVERGLADHT